MLKSLLFGKDGGMTKGELNKLSQRSKLTEYMPWISYDPDSKCYVNTDNSFGFIWECTPISFAGEKTLQTLMGLFRAGLPFRSTIQLTLYADNNVDHYLNRFKAVKVRNTPLINKTAEMFSDYIKEGTKGIASCAGIPIRNFRLFVTVKCPIADKQNEFKVGVLDLYNNVREVLKGSMLDPHDMKPHQLIDLLRRLLNDREFPYKETYDDTIPIRKQIIMAETTIEKDLSNLKIGKKVFRCITPKACPDLVDALQTNELFGGVWGIASDGDQIKSPFLYTLNICFHDLKNRLHNKCDIVLQQKGVGSFAPSLMRKQAEYLEAVNLLDRGVLFVRVIPIMWTWGDNEVDAAEAISRIKRIWEAKGYVMQEDKGILPILFISALPLGLIDREKNIDNLDRDFIVPSDVVPLIMPVQADFAGGGEPVVTFCGRKGQMISIDLFDRHATNNHMFIAAGSGAGKSFTVNYLAFNEYARDTLVRIIDIGRSYEKMTGMLGAKFMDFNDTCGICINPFSTINNIEEDLSVTAAVIQQMIFSATDTVPADYAETTSTLVKEAVSWAWSERETLADIDLVAEYLRTYPQHATSRMSENASGAIENLKTVAHTIAYNLEKFTSMGTYGKWFNGPSNFDISRDDFVVLELDGLVHQKELFKVVVLQVLNAVMQNMYFSDRARRKMVIFDEAWRVIQGDNQYLREVIEAGYRTGRKFRASFSVVTQSCRDLKNFGKIGDVIRANSAFKMYLQSNDFEDASRDNLIDVDPFTLKLMKTVTNVKPKYSEIFMDTPFGIGVARLVVDPFSYYVYTSEASEVREIEAHVQGGLSYEDAIQRMVDKYRSAG